MKKLGERNSNNSYKSLHGKWSGKNLQAMDKPVHLTSKVIK